MPDKNFIATPVESYLGGDPNDLAGTGGATNSMVPGAPPPAGGSPPFKGLEPIEGATPKGISIIGPPVNKPGA